ncbi:MAG TPA: hypothetical protein VFJ58_27540, partial [Armatimonadota bacterium]|nr:hypothetical protein [Armatimonadota bacterium]
MSENRETPNGWAEASLSDLATTIRGIAFPKEAKQFEAREGHIACLRTANVQRTVDWTDLWYIPLTFVRNPDQELQVGDVLMSTANSLNLVGKVAYVSSLAQRVTLGAFIATIRPTPGLDSRYVYWQLASGKTQDRIRSGASTTTNISNISTGHLAALQLSVAPFLEQRRIVAEIEKQFSRLDAGVAALQRVQKALKRYRASVLQAACEGRLVPTEAELARKEGRDYEPADQLLQRILAERRARW